LPSKAGESGRYLELLRPLQRQLELYCRRALSNSSLAEDVLQTVVAKTFADFGNFSEGTNFRAWIFRYLHFEVLACNRRESTVTATVEELPQASSWEQLIVEQSFDRLLEDSEDILDQCDQMIANAVRQLPEIERAVFLLRAIGDFKHAEIGEILNVPLGTVMSHLSRGRAALRYRLLEFARERGHFRQEKGPQRVPRHDDAPHTPSGEDPP
jgi:RNA polymerase sigma-70 factor (ECF subfamily)